MSRTHAPRPRWRRTTRPDGRSVYSIRTPEHAAIERLAAKAVRTETQVMDDLLAQARRPLTAEESREPPRFRRPIDEEAVARAADEVTRVSEARRWTFTADPARRRVLGPGGEVIRAGWTAFAAYCRDKGLDPARLADGSVPIRNSESDVTVNRQPLRYLDRLGSFRIR